MIRYFLLLFPILAIGQTQSENYIKAISYKQELTSVNLNPAANVGTVKVVYFDGLGRPMQVIDGRQSGSGNDLITHIEYDQFGRQIKDYLPYADTSPSLEFVENAGTPAESFYNSSMYGNTLNPYSEKFPEASPLNRIRQQAAPGNPWSMGTGHTVKLGYQINTETDAVRNYKATSTWNAATAVYVPAMINGNGSVYYPANKLYKTVTMDENWVSGKGHTTEEFKDRMGRIVLKRVYGESVVNGSSVTDAAHDTYYVYDQYGNLTYVIPPLASGNTITADILNNLCYQYRYDYRNRMIEKKLPGKQWEYTVYDKRDRIVATGPVFNPFGGTAEGWLITRYDRYDRPALTGWYPATGISSTQRFALQDSFNNPVINMVRGNSTIDGIATGYSAPVLPFGFKLLTLNYYDNYTFLDASLPLPATSPELDYINSTGSITVKGLLTGSWIRVLTSASSAEGETSYILYDKKLRPVRTYTKNHLDGYTYTDSKLSFTGKTLYSTTHHRLGNNGAELTIRDNYTYDDQERVLKHTHSINSGPAELLSSNQYTELGRLAYKWVGGTDLSGGSGLQKIDYSYNIRGWLTGINDVNGLNVAGDSADLFALKINYNKVENCLNYTGTPLYNGNISETYWRSSSDNILRKYGYKYDEINRLRQAIYQKPDLSAPVTNSYDEELNYDKNGNITALSRNGYYDNNSGDVYTIDKLNYSYRAGTNQLEAIDDESNSLDGFRDINNSTDYKYDANGNLTADLNKDIEVTYNHLNLPTEITFRKGKITYIYNAAGEKVSKFVMNESESTTNTTLYQDGFQYINDELRFFPTSEGYVNVVKDKYNYVYNYTDHLGNVRLSFLADPKTGKPAIMEENNYYPFGLKHENYNSEKYKLVKSEDGVSIVLEPTERNIYQYKFNGKEFQDELGLDMYDYGVRGYMPDLGRTTTLDPLAEKFYSFSPQSFLNNNPLYFVDPTGMAADGWIKSITNGNTSYTYDSKVNTVDEAKAAGYDNVADVQQGYNISATNDSYSYNLNQDGSVTNASDGSNVAFNTPIKNGIFTVGGSMTTAGGSTINTTNLGSNPLNAFPRATGAVTEMNFSSPFFSWGWAVKGLGYAWNGLFGAAANTTAAASGSVYSVAYETTLSSELFPGGSYYSHFKAANTSLSNTITSDAAFSNSMSNLGISVPRSATGTILGKSPANWVWHHDVEAGVMQLVPKTQHTTGSIFWNTLHPEGVGGMHIWNK